MDFLDAQSLLTVEYDQPLVSVIIPFYNAYQYIHEALQSCIDNSYSNMEIILIDDFSHPPLKIEDIKIDAKKRPVFIIRNEMNKGPGYSRNVGIKKAGGELIAFLDSDDIWYSKIIEKQVDVFRSEPTAVWVYTDGRYLINNKIKNKPNSYYHGFKGGKLPKGKEVNECHLRGYNYMTFSSNMFKKSVLLEVGLFDEALDVSEDWDLFVRVAEKYSVHAIDEPLMIYRVNNNGRHIINRKDYVEVNVRILKNMYTRQNLLPGRINDFNRAVAAIYERAGIQRLNAGFNKEARAFLFHPKTYPISWQLRMICLRILSLLPNKFYYWALWLYDRF